MMRNVKMSSRKLTLMQFGSTGRTAAQKRGIVMNCIFDAVRSEARAMNAHIAEMRRHIHRHPELGLDTAETASFIAERLREAGIGGVREPDGTHGIIAEIKGALPGRTLALRADIDALPIEEETGLPFASERRGAMHACGHDAHAAMLIGAAEMIAAHRDVLRGSVRLIFQPGEEIGLGAKLMIKHGALDGVDAAAALHTGSLWEGAEAGGIGYRYGAMMAAGDKFTITVTGRGGHGAAPERSVDPITVSCAIHSALQTLISRELPPAEPAVLSVCSIHAGEASNIIPGECVMSGTMRTLSQRTRETLARRITEIAEGTAASMRARAEVKMTFGVPPAVSSGLMVRRLVRAASAVLGDDAVRGIERPAMCSDDIARYLERVPGVLFFHPSTFGDERDFPHHHPKFTVNEDVLWTGAAVEAALALTWQDDISGDD